MRKTVILLKLHNCAILVAIKVDNHMRDEEFVTPRLQQRVNLCFFALNAKFKKN